MKKTSLLFLSFALISPVIAAEPTQLELAQKAIKATQLDRMFDQMGAQMQLMAAQSLNLSSPDLTPAQKEAATKTLGEVTKVATDATKGILQEVDTIYADVYSEAELKAMVTFFDSPEGKSMLQKQPQVMERLRPLIQNMQREIMPKIQQIVAKARIESGANTTPNTGPTLVPSNKPVEPTPTPSTSPGPLPKPPTGNSGGPVPLPPSGVKTSVQ